MLNFIYVYNMNLRGKVTNMKKGVLLFQIGIFDGQIRIFIRKKQYPRYRKGLVSAFIKLFL